MQDIQKTIEQIFNKTKAIQYGTLPAYIPELTKVDPNLYSISITTTSGQTFCYGEYRHEFTIQSLSKPFTYGLALEKHGRDNVLKKVSVEPTGDPYNSIKLLSSSNKPYNPMVNAGAIVCASMIPGENTEERIALIKNTLDVYAGRELAFDQAVYNSEKALGNHNRAIGYLLLNFGVISGNVEKILDTYFQHCSFLLNSNDLSVMAATLANGGINPITQQQAVDSYYIQDILTVMFTCGMYDFAGEWAYTVGIPAKSGVSGGIMGVVPGRMGIAVFSPLLGDRGSSCRGIKTFQALSQALHLSVFRND